jgi:cytoskeleton protein RodZ
MSKTGFGEHLKREREMRGVSRDEICAATRIGTRFLDALENEQWEILPGGIFNRGFVRAVARFLGLDEDDLVAEYDIAFSEQNLEIAASVSTPTPRQVAKPRRRRFASLGALAVLVLLGTGWIGWRWRQSYGLRQAPHRGNGAAAVIPTSQADSPASTPFAAGPSPTASTTSPPRSSPAPAEIQGLQLKIEAGKETTVSVSADGSKAFEGSMIAGQSRTFTAQTTIDISAKDAGALLLELNGQTLAPLGPPGQPGNITLTRSDLKPAGGGAD